MTRHGGNIVFSINVSNKYLWVGLDGSTSIPIDENLTFVEAHQTHSIKTIRIYVQEPEVFRDDFKLDEIFLEIDYFASFSVIGVIHEFTFSLFSSKLTSFTPTSQLR